MSDSFSFIICDLCPVLHEKLKLRISTETQTNCPATRHVGIYQTTHDSWLARWHFARQKLRKDFKGEADI
jgi:hypothetical protein